MRATVNAPINYNKSSSILMKRQNSNNDHSKNQEKKSIINPGPGFDLSQISILPPSTAWVQPKLSVNTPGDKYEQEADRVANQVMRMPDNSISSEISKVPTKAQRTCYNCEEEVQAKSNGQMPKAVTNSLTQRIQNSKSSGKAMNSDTQSFMSSRFGIDFSNIRIHDNSNSAKMNKEINARAFTVGENVFFNQGEYQPTSESGKRLLAHELVHTMQQGGINQIRRQSDSCEDNPMQTVVVDFLSFRGSNRDPNSDLAEANRIYAPCCVQFVVGMGKSIDSTVSDPLMGGDTTLDRLHSCSDASEEEKNLRESFPLSGRLRAFYVERINPSARAVSFRPSCSGGSRAPFVNYTYVTNGAASRTLAHEFGHILLDGNFHDLPSDNLMHPSNTATGSNLTAGQCETIRNSI